jgi:hypothetical protein
MKSYSTPGQTTPLGLARYAQDFYDAAVAADDVLGIRPGYEIIAPIPVMYLVGHSIELILKSYLISRGMTLPKLKSKAYGHNLVACLMQAEELGLTRLLTFTPEDYDVLRVLNELYSTKQLNYIVTGQKKFPVFGPLQVLCTKLLNAVHAEVGFAARA